MIVMLKCPCCDRDTVEAQKWWLDRWLKVQNHLVANKVKYTPAEYKKRYNRTQRWIEKLDPWFRKVSQL